MSHKQPGNEYGLQRTETGHIQIRKFIGSDIE